MDNLIMNSFQSIICHYFESTPCHLSGSLLIPVITEISSDLPIHFKPTYQENK